MAQATKTHDSAKQTNSRTAEIGRPHEAVAQNGISAEFMYLADGIVHGFLFPVALVHFRSSSAHLPYTNSMLGMYSLFTA